MGYPQLPQRPIPPVHHVWVASLALRSTSLPLELVPPEALAFLHQHTMIPS